MKGKVVVAFFAGIAVVYAFLVPPYEAPDEPDHLAYINFLAQRGTLPNQYDPEHTVPKEGHQPPLYYLIGALIVRLTQPDDGVNLSPIPHRPPDPRYPSNIPIYRHVGQSIFPTPADRVGFYLLRLMSVLIATVNVALALRLITRFLPDTSEVQRLAIVMLLGIPQFAFISGVINNDNLANLMATAVLLSLSYSLQEKVPFWRWGLTGLMLGLGLLAKKTLLFLLPLVGMVAWLAYRRDGGSAWRGFAIALGAIALVSGWWFYRNYALYGDWLGTEMERRTLPELLDPKPLFSRYFVSSFWRVLVGSAVASFGWMNVGLPKPFYWLVWLTLGVSVFGLMRSWKRVSCTLWVGLLSVGLCVAGIVYYNLTYTQPQGRFLFPTLPLICALMAWGVSAWWGGRVPRWLFAMMVFFALMLHLSSWVTLYLFYYPEHRYVLPKVE